ncbi:hypothetical protein M011DRAFT_304608 [Sporormia fimetaria CBS 119925]|uniref:L domain-like protein n=1 Tax=Sporormia fimetaria CBS 119925 TaxID=1340428 RepID=A0A6A6VHP4_9PLEO|nr:hypothetical protein M011DRAFT_304608 [Sporormia fimetaria CBS 119925]
MDAPLHPQQAPLSGEMPSSPPPMAFVDPPSPTSSEPPLFSSDSPYEHDDVGNYSTPREKRKRVGTWWDGEDATPRASTKRRLTQANHSGIQDEEEATPRPSSKRRLTRANDSGIYMDEDFAMSAPTPPRRNDFYDLISAAADKPGRRRMSYVYDSRQLRDEDLVHLGLLQQVVYSGPDSGKDVPHPRQFQPLVPEALVLVLTQNSLRYLHPNLFKLEYLTHLLLSRNNIEQLPPLVSRLRNLKHLNLSHNRLRYLPEEIQQLLKHGDLSVNLFNNPLVRPSNSDLFPGIHRLFGALYSRVTYFDETGAVLGGSPPDFVDDQALDCVLRVRKVTTNPGDPPFRPSTSSNAKSLFTLTLENALGQLTPPTLRSYMPDEMPPPIHEALSRVEERYARWQLSMLTCRCSRRYAVARASWIEFWQVNVPTHVQVCSWACVQRYHPSGDLYEDYAAKTMLYEHEVLRRL